MSSRRILTSWKEIAEYLNRGVRTVQRYEKSLGLPVRRLSGGTHTSVMAFSDEIDLWLNRARLRTSDFEITEDFPPVIKHNGSGTVKIFMIEDDAECVEKFRSTLSALESYELEVLPNSAQAIGALTEVIAGEAEAPNLIVLDYELQDSSGFDVLRHYRSSVQLKAAVPLIVWTVLDNLTTKELSLWMGAQAFVPKQRGLEVLSSVVISTLRRGSLHIENQARSLSSDVAQ